jgi:hypothetical protein
MNIRNGGRITTSDVVYSSMAVVGYPGVIFYANSYGIDVTRYFMFMNQTANAGYYTCIWDSSIGNTYSNCFFSGANSAINFYFSNSTVNDCVAQNISLYEFQNYSSADFADANFTLNNWTYRQLAATPVQGTNAPNVAFYTYAANGMQVIDNNGYHYTSSTPTATTGFITDNVWGKNFAIKCQDLQNVTGDNRVYLAGHSIVFKDTNTVRTANHPSLQFNLGWSSVQKGQYATSIEFKLPCNSNDTVMVRGYARKDSNYGSSTLPYIDIEASDSSVDTSDTMSDTDDTWELLAVEGTVTSTGTVTIKMVAQSTAANAIAYFADWRAYVGNNVYSLGEDWLDGYPQASPVASTVDSSNIWNTSTSGYSSGTMGYNVDLIRSTSTIVDAVWDEVIMTSHTTTNSTGQVLREIRRRER